MAEQKIRFKVIEKYLTIAILAETLLFVLYLILAGTANTEFKVFLKVFLAVVCLLISILILAFLYLRKELFRPRCVWMTFAAAAIVVCVVLSLLLEFPSPKPLAASQAAAFLMQMQI